MRAAGGPWPAPRLLGSGPVSRPRSPAQFRRRQRAAGIVAAALLAVMPLAGCGGGGEGSSTQCSLTQCTITLDRTGDSTTRILGVEVRLVGASGDQATIEVAGQQLQLQVNQQAQVGGFQVSLQELTGQQAVVRISQGGGDGGG
jgi:hypothetical protein